MRSPFQRHQLASYGWNYSFDSLIVRGDPSFQHIVYEAAGSFHESAHWLQHIGTTAGLFLTACGCALNRLIVKGLSQFDSKQRTIVLSHRFDAESPRPFVRIRASPNDYRLEFTDDYSPELDAYQQSLYDVWWTRGVFFGSISESKLYKPPNEIVALAYQDVSRIFMEDTGEIDRSIPAFPVRGDCSSVRTKLGLLTTYHLLESQTLANEVAMSLHAKMDLATLMLKYLAREEYRLPIRLWCEHVGEKDELKWITDPIHLSVFCIACDYALNPPIPPTTLEPDGGEWVWDDIHPPKRFLRLVPILESVCEAAKASDRLPTSEILCEWTGIPVSNDATIELPEAWQFDDFSKAMNGDYHEYLYFASAGALAIGSESRMPFAIPSMEKRYTISVTDDKQVILRRNDTATSPFLSAPVVTDGTQLFITEPYEKTFCESLVRSVASTYPLYDLAFTVNPISFDPFPTQVTNEPGFSTLIRKHIEDAFGVTDWLKI